MPLPPPDKPAWPPAHVAIDSPREAALRAIVYRGHLREKPRERGLRIAGLVGTLLVHLIFLLGAVLGPAYEPEPLPAEPLGVLHVRLIDNKPEPPPPPVRGTPPKQRGPRHRGSVARATPVPHAVATRRATAATAPAAQPLPPVPAPPIDRPVIATPPRPSAPTPKLVAAPLPPVSVPKPAPAPELQPVAVSPPPPAITLQAPVATKPVPPRFQPEPVRKAQVEGTRPMPPPASLALPEVPAQSAPAINPPSIALDKIEPASVAAPAAVAVARAETPAAPPAPEWQAVPLPATAAPTVNLKSSLQAPTPVVARERPQVQSPTIRVAAVQLAEEPLPPAEAAPATPRVQAPSVTLQTPALPSAALDIQPPVARAAAAAPAAPAAAAPSPAPAPSSPAPASAPAAAPAERAPAEAAASAATTGHDVSRAPDAVPQGSDTANPGQPDGVDKPVPPAAGSHAGNLASTTAGQGNVTGAQGHGMQGSPEGTYIQLVPHGDTQIMEHRTKGIHYQSTVFDQYWTPEGESSLDTALRRAVEKTTVSHTFHLPRGVRIKCVGMPLLPVLMFGCGNPDPPAKALDAKTYQRLNLPTLNTSIPKVATPGSAPAPAAPVALDNGALCAAARVSGGPLPAGCDAGETGGQPAARPVAAPARAGSSWVPASDQFH